MAIPPVLKTGVRKDLWVRIPPPPLKEEIKKGEKMPAQDKKQSTLKTKPSEVTVVPPPAKDLLVWQAPTRPFKKRGREYFSTIAAVVFLLAIILLFIKEWLLIGVIIALMFISYVLGTVPPQKATYKITTRGVTVGDKTYKWTELQRFWFSQKWDSQIIHFETLIVFPHQLQLVLGKTKKEEVKKIVEKYLTFEKPKKNFFDKATAWLEEKVPLESK